MHINIWLSMLSMLLLCGCNLVLLPHNQPINQANFDDAFTQNERLGRGINLGNALEGPYEGAWGVVLREEFFPTIADAGFDSVRVPIKWSIYAGTEPPYTISSKIFVESTGCWSRHRQAA